MSQIVVENPVSNSSRAVRFIQRIVPTPCRRCESLFYIAADVIRGPRSPKKSPVPLGPGRSKTIMHTPFAPRPTARPRGLNETPAHSSYYGTGHNTQSPSCFSSALNT